MQGMIILILNVWENNDIIFLRYNLYGACSITPSTSGPFKTVGKSFQVKLVERMPRVCKAVIKAKDGYLDLYNTLLVTT
jgi:hypothetical protein